MTATTGGPLHLSEAGRESKRASGEESQPGSVAQQEAEEDPGWFFSMERN